LYENILDIFALKCKWVLKLFKIHATRVHTSTKFTCQASSKSVEGLEKI